MRSPLAIVLVVLGLVVIAAGGLSLLMETALIISIGVLLTALLTWALFGLGALGLLAGVCVAISRALKGRQARLLEATTVQDLSFTRDDIPNPDKVREYLLRTTGGKPLLQDIKDRGLAQMKDVDDKQSQLAGILKVSKEETLD